MNFSLYELAWNLLYNALWVALAGLVVHQIVRWLQPTSPRIQRAAWFLVLIPGCLLFDLRFQIPLVTQLSNPTRLIDIGSHDPTDVTAPIETVLSVTEPASIIELDLAMASEGALASQGNEIGREIGRLTARDKNDSFVSSSSEPNFDALAPLPPDQKPDSHRAGASTTKQLTSLATLATGQISPGTNITPLAIQTWQVFTSVNWPRIVVLVWIVGGVILLLWTLLQFTAFQISLRDSQPARKHWNRQWRALLVSQKIDRTILLLEHDSHGPMLTVTPRGLAVVIPRDYWEEISASQRLGVLRHELAHYQRSDIFWSLAAQLLVWPQWFNPLAWYALKRFDECAEWSCDAQLVKDTPVQVTDYANALVTLIEFPNSSPIASRAAKGSSIANRIRRLVNQNSARDSAIKRICITSVLAVLFASSLIRIQLVAQSEPIPSRTDDGYSENLSSDSGTNQNPANEQSPAEVSNPQVATFISKLDVKNDKSALIEKFAAALKTAPGQIILGDRTANHENYLREQAEADSTPVFISEYFEKSGDKYVLKKGLENYADQFQAACKIFEQDTAAMAIVLKDYGNRMAQDNDANQLIRRFLMDENTPAQIYVDRVQDQVRPDYRVVRQHFNEIFVLDRNNQLTVRAGGKGRAEQLAKSMEKAQRMADRLQRAIGEWRLDLSDSDPVSKMVREAMSEPIHSCMNAVDNMNEDYSIDQRIDNYFEFVENMFIDKADGLVPSDDRLDEIKHALQEYSALKQLVGKIEPHMVTLSGQLTSDDELCKRWKLLFTSDIAAVWVARQMGTIASEPDIALKNWLDEWLVETADGKLSVNMDRQEEMVNNTREWLRSNRAVRRRGLDIAEFGKHLANPSLAVSYQTLAGKCLVMRSIQDKISRQYFDGLGAWINEHFDASDDGFTLKEGHDYELTSFLENVESLKKELANDDF